MKTCPDPCGRLDASLRCLSLVPDSARREADVNARDLNVAGGYACRALWPSQCRSGSPGALQQVGDRWLAVATVLAVAAGHVAVAVALSAKRGGGKATGEVEYAGVADVGLLSDQTAAASLGLAGLSGQGRVGMFDLAARAGEPRRFAAPDEEPWRYC